MKKLLAFVAMQLLMIQSAQALFEAKISYGLLGSKANLSPLCPTCTGTTPDIVPTYGLGLDASVSLPIPLLPGVGLRYEDMGLTASSNGIDFKAAYKRTALTLNWRLIDTLLYVGPIVTYGLSHSTSIKATQGGTTRSDFSTNKVSSYSLGLEAGVHLLGFLVGGELGYMDMRWKDATDSTGNAPTQDINMSGSYLKVMLGISI